MITSPKDYQAHLFSINNPNHRQQIIGLPIDEPIYKIDLNKRTIETPEFLSVNLDHVAETIFFEVDRYFDSTDLAEMTCVIPFTNANPDKKRNGFIYHPPFIDVRTKPGKIIIPWVIEGPATLFEGTVTFAFQFYKLERLYNGLTARQFEIENGYHPEFRRVENLTREQFETRYYYLKNDKNEYYYNDTFNEDEVYYEKYTSEELKDIIDYRYGYNLNTLPAKSKILHGMDKLLNVEGEELNYEVDALHSVLEAIDRLEKAHEERGILYWTILEDEK